MAKLFWKILLIPWKTRERDSDRTKERESDRMRERENKSTREREYERAIE